MRSEIPLQPRVVPADIPWQEVPVHAAAHVDPGKLRFLVVDDFAPMRRILRDLLGELGYANVEEAEDGAAAWQKLRRDDFDCVISDWHMPKMDGLRLLQAIRGDVRLGTLPVLLVTAAAKRDSLLAVLRAGASGYIVKPFTATALSEKLSRIFANAGR